MWNELLEKVRLGDDKSISRAVSLIENEAPGYQDILRSIPFNDSIKITGITGPPGAGKSTIADLLIQQYTNAEKRVAVLCIDPSSPFTRGALLGDRIRMRQWYNHPLVYIRSLSSRGLLGGLNPSIIEICDLIKAAPFDHIMIETVGVGQSEIEIVTLADTTVVIQVPEGGDEIQTMKAGLMETADVFVVNKCDRPGADAFIRNLKSIMSAKDGQSIPVIGMIASSGQGVEKLAAEITRHENDLRHSDEKKIDLLTERALYLIRKKIMGRFDKAQLRNDIERSIGEADFNIYRLTEKYSA